MMEPNASVSSMVMYEDESVEIRYGNEAELQLSPCGCEFLLVRAADPRGHPLQPTERVRQRTRFTISAYKLSNNIHLQEFLVAALAFRNKYSTRPYLVDELIPADQKKPFFSIDSEVRWPRASLCDFEFGPEGETIIRSEDGRAALTLSPSGEDFIAEFKCTLSQARSQHHHDGNTQRQAVINVTSPGGDSGVSDDSKDTHQAQGSSSIKPPATVLTIKAEKVFQSTTVVQHHSCCAVSPTWSYPLSLAQHQRTARTDAAPERVQANGSRTQTQEEVPKKRRSHLPQALPLSCPTPHWHRWKLKDPLAKKEHSDEDLPTELVKVMWCQGVTYRILSGAVSVIEVSPGDGSLIRSNGVLDSYFTHYKPQLQSGEVKEVTYHLYSLPPDVPGQPYSVYSIVNRASRILTCYNQAKQSLKLPALPSCLLEASHFTEPKISQESLSSVPSVKQQINVAQSRSDLVADELEKIKRFNFLLENSHLLRGDRSCRERDSISAEDLTPEPVNENCIAEALQRTSKAIQDIDALISAATLT